MFGWISQIAAVAGLNLRSLPERKGSSAVAVVGIAGVVAVLVATLAMAAGLRHTMAGTGSPDTVIVLRNGADTEITSGMSREEATLVAEAPGLARLPGGGAAASREVLVIVNLPRESTGADANVPLRGVEEAAFAIRDRVEIVEGRRFESGKREIIVGRRAARAFAGLEVGSSLTLGKNVWEVVGIFTAGGTVPESELWTDVGALQPAYRRSHVFQSVYARLESPGSLNRFKDALTSDARLEVSVRRESEYYARQSQLLVRLIRGLGTLTVVMMAAGAIFAALNTMYTAVSSRTREIATLRALGFGAGPVVLSVLAEALFLALVAGLLGGGIAHLLFDGFQVATLNFQSFSQVAFAFDVSARALLWGVLMALSLGLLGGLLPAVRAARMPVAQALREE